MFAHSNELIKEKVEKPIDLWKIGPTEEEKRTALLAIHKRAAIKHAPYVETDNKRPGPSMLTSQHENQEMMARKNITWNKPQFDLTSARLSLDLVEWRKVLAVHCARSSASGVFFASQIHGAFVLKACGDVVSSFFCSKLYRLLSIPTPEVKVIAHYESEFKFMLHSLERVSFHDDTLRYLIRVHMDRPFILLQEYIPAIKLTNMGEKRSDRCFNVAFPDASNRLINMGKMIAADIVVNNPDRFPAIWDNFGNNQNVLFEIKTDEKINDELFRDLDYSGFSYGDATAIDNKCYCIKQDDRRKIQALKEYIQKVEDFLEAIFQDL